MWTERQRQLHNVLDKAMAEKVKRRHLYVVARAKYHNARSIDNRQRYAAMVAVFGKASKKANANAQRAVHNFEKL